MNPKEQSSETDLLLQFYLSLEKVKIDKILALWHVNGQINEENLSTVSDLSKAQRLIQLGGR